MSDVLVVGCGLLGTSAGLALQGSDIGDVTLWDRDPGAVDLAVSRGAGRAWNGEERARIAVVAVPPKATAPELLRLQVLDVARTYTHVASVQSHVEAEVQALSSDPSRIVGGHPLAGREVSGGGAALADLFVGRPWAVCRHENAASDAVDEVRALARACGAIPLEVQAKQHDAAVALVSHLPQVVSSALAALLLGAPGSQEPPLLELSGPGLADTTRLAASSPSLWSEVLEANAWHVAPAVRRLAADLGRLASNLEVLAGAHDGDRASALSGLEDLLVRGNAGRRLVPVKRGELAGSFAGVRVDLPDEPGRLADLLRAAGEAGVNVEDLRVEHVPGRPRGVVELLVAPARAGGLAQALSTAGWKVSLST
ncbi:MAG TPA: prephenate dehydrogenase [Mycobacteriales bacterium]|nr:prephenate dehydrogenase [Mycobacteriales bacterium]